MSVDRYTDYIEKIATYLNTWYRANSSHEYYLPQVPQLTVGPPIGARFGVLLQRGKISNELDGGDTCPYSDRINFDIFILVNDGSLGDEDKATFMNIAVDETFRALRSTEVGDPPFGILVADENRVQGSSPGTFNGTTAEMIALTILMNEEY